VSPPRAVHDPGKIVADLAAAVALGGDCLADIAVLREQSDLAGPVASDPVVSRLVAVLAGDLPRALAGDSAPGSSGQLVTVDLDATIVISHSEKEQASPTWKKTFGFHPMTAWADHGQEGNGEFLTWLTAKSRRLHYSVGMTITEAMQDAIGKARDRQSRLRSGSHSGR
jgi:hypothetical protein